MKQILRLSPTTLTMKVTDFIYTYEIWDGDNKFFCNGRVYAG